jgi:methyltransferase
LHEISIFVCIYSIIIGFYWGYQVYDLIIGTSERGVSHEKISEFPPFQHAMIIFGGLQGLEKAMEQEAHLKNPEQLFQFYINTCPEQGSRTIRTEEAILISLSCLREKLLASAIS